MENWNVKLANEKLTTALCLFEPFTHKGQHELAMEISYTNHAENIGLRQTHQHACTITLKSLESLVITVVLVTLVGHAFNRRNW